MTSDMRSVIIPKSDQLNSDTLLGGPITITITSVSIRPATEQPVSINYEGDGGKPYKPCKSMARVMVSLWGPDANLYVGRSMSLYCDPKVLWGGIAVGGIRISHMSHIERTASMMLTATKGNKKPFTVQPLTDAPKTKGQPQPKGDGACGIVDALGVFHDCGSPEEWRDQITKRVASFKSDDQIRAFLERNQTVFTQIAVNNAALVDEVRLLLAERIDEIGKTQT